MTTKTRCTIYLTEEQDKRSKDVAELMGISRNAVIQQAVAQYLMAFGMIEKKLDNLQDAIKGQMIIGADGTIKEEK